MVRTPVPGDTGCTSPLPHKPSRKPFLLSRPVSDASGRTSGSRALRPAVLFRHIKNRPARPSAQGDLVPLGDNMACCGVLAGGCRPSIRESCPSRPWREFRAHRRESRPPFSSKRYLPCRSCTRTSRYRCRPAAIPSWTNRDVGSRRRPSAP